MAAGEQGSTARSGHARNMAAGKQGSPPEELLLIR